MDDIRVLIVDDVDRVRQDLITFLTLTGSIQIVGEAANGREAVHLAETLQPQVVLMDLEMPVMDGFEATREIKACLPACRVIALTIHGDPLVRQRAFDTGADDFIPKDAPLPDLVDSIHRVSATGQMLKGDVP